MTEAEAKLRWCPWAASRIMTWPASATTRNTSMFVPEGEEAPRPTCVASFCMAWRWHGNADGERDPDSGFCGIAGKDGAP